MDRKTNKNTKDAKNKNIKIDHKITEEIEEENKIGEMEKVITKENKLNQNAKALQNSSSNALNKTASPDDHEFLEGLKLLNNLVTKAFCDNVIYIFFSKLENESAKFTIYEKQRIWLKKFTKQDFIEFKEKMSLQGNWHLFFDSMGKAINKNQGGEMSLKFLKEKKDKLQLKLFHPISEEIKIKTEIIFDEFIPEENIEFNKLSFELCVDSVNFLEKKIQDNTKLLIAVEKLDEQGQFKKADDLDNAGSKASSKLDFKKNLKRKFVSDLINPNLKKRKANANKFMNSSSSSIEDEA